MGNCLATKLKEAVGDESLYKIGEARIEITQANEGGFYLGCEGMVSVLAGKIRITSTGKEYDSSSEPFSLSSARNIKILEDGTILSFSDKYGFKFFQGIEGTNDTCIRFLDEKILDNWLFLPTAYKGIFRLCIDLENKPWGYTDMPNGIGQSTANRAFFANFSFENFDIEHLPNVTQLYISSHKFIPSTMQDIVNFAKHNGLTVISIFDARSLFGGEVSDLAEAWIKNGRTTGVVKLECNVNMTINGRACAYRELVWIHLDSSLPNGYELTSTEPILPL